MREEALLFGSTRSLVGIVTDPQEAERNHNLPAFILLNAGVIHRIGPHRLHVKMARSLATMGFVVLRFDFSGIGDSKVRADNLPFEESIIRETQEAMDYLSGARGVTQFVLVGISSGAVASARAARSDARVVGAVLINPQGYGDDMRSYVKARRYWKNILTDPKRWARAIVGKANYRTIGPHLRNLFSRRGKALSVANNVAADFRLLTERGVVLRLIYSTGDLGLDYLNVSLGNGLRELSSSGKLKIEMIPQADHTCTLLRSQQHLLEAVQNFAQGMVQG